MHQDYYKMKKAPSLDRNEGGFVGLSPRQNPSFLLSWKQPRDCPLLRKGFWGWTRAAKLTILLLQGILKSECKAVQLQYTNIAAKSLPYTGLNLELVQTHFQNRTVFHLRPLWIFNDSLAVWTQVKVGAFYICPQHTLPYFTVLPGSMRMESYHWVSHQKPHSRHRENTSPAQCRVERHVPAIPRFTESLIRSKIQRTMLQPPWWRAQITGFLRNRLAIAK